jgi:hypothetical protein
MGHPIILWLSKRYSPLLVTQYTSMEEREDYKARAKLCAKSTLISMSAPIVKSFAANKLRQSLRSTARMPWLRSALRKSRL